MVNGVINFLKHRRKTVKHKKMILQKSNFYGVDASNEISLLEYGLLVYSEKHEDNSGTQFCVYRIDDVYFGTGHYSEEEINNLLNGQEWADSESLNGFFDYIGITDSDREQYIKTPNLATKLHDLKSYFGHENIFGSDYNPITETEAITLYL